MQAVIKKWGNSPALRLSSAIMKSAKLNLYQEVTIHIQRGRIVIEPSTPSGFVLDDLIAQISKKIYILKLTSEIQLVVRFGDAQILCSGCGRYCLVAI